MGRFTEPQVEESERLSVNRERELHFPQK